MVQAVSVVAQSVDFPTKDKLTHPKPEHWDAGQPAAGVGDGGASWRLKALKRARETAQREGKQLSDVVGGRWGSLSDLTAGAMQARAAPSAPPALRKP
jgi:hypothetical protein